MRILHCFGVAQYKMRKCLVVLFVKQDDFLAHYRCHVPFLALFVLVGSGAVFTNLPTVLLLLKHSFQPTTNRPKSNTPSPPPYIHLPFFFS